MHKNETLVCVNFQNHLLLSPQNMKPIRIDFRTALYAFAVVTAFATMSCDKNAGKSNTDTDSTQAILPAGSGNILYTGYAPLADRPILVYYHIPTTTNESSPMLIVFHGAGRDAKESRDAMIDLANTKRVILVVPEFSDEYYPGSNRYNLLNIFADGENPSAATMHSKDIWTSAVIEPLFSFMKQKVGSKVITFDVFGHSAGAQVAHRYLFLAQSEYLDRVVSASAGWYTMPDLAIDFPYGLNETNKTDEDLKTYFGKKMYVIVGANDIDPNSYNLRHTPEADVQGNNRVERAQYFYGQAQLKSQQLGVSLAWQYKSIPDAGHDFDLTSAAAMNILY